MFQRLAFEFAFVISKSSLHSCRAVFLQSKLCQDAELFSSFSTVECSEMRKMNIAFHLLTFSKRIGRGGVRFEICIQPCLF